MKVLHVRVGLVKGNFCVQSCSVVSVEASVHGAFLKGYSKVCLMSRLLASAWSTAVRDHCSKTLIDTTQAQAFSEFYGAGFSFRLSVNLLSFTA